MKSFREYLNESMSQTVACCFGRFQPPTIGHEKLFDTMRDSARGGNAMLIFTSSTNDNKKNPLTFQEKIHYLKEMFPEFAPSVSSDNSLNTIIEVMKRLETLGYKNVKYFCGSDRIDSFQSLLNQYNGKEYNFDSIEVLSAGNRDPDSEDNVTSMSASELRQAAIDNNYKQFLKGMPSGFSQSKELFDLLRTRLT